MGKNIIRIVLALGLIVLLLMVYVLFNPFSTRAPKEQHVAYLTVKTQIRPIQERIQEYVRERGMLAGSGSSATGLAPSADAKGAHAFSVLPDGEILAKLRFGAPASSS